MTREFFDKYEMRVVPSRHKLRRMKPRHLRTDVWNSRLSDELVWNLTDDAEEVECVDVVIPKDRLTELEKILEWYENNEYKLKRTDQVVEQLRQDERVRIENPSVEKAYMNYKLLLELARK